MPTFNFPRLVQQLSQPYCHRHLSLTNGKMRRAGLAVILRPAMGATSSSIEVLYIKRAQKPGAAGGEGDFGVSFPGACGQTITPSHCNCVTVACS
jgi:hypothetical protein